MIVWIIYPTTGLILSKNTLDILSKNTFVFDFKAGLC